MVRTYRWRWACSSWRLAPATGGPDATPSVGRFYCQWQRTHLGWAEDVGEVELAGEGWSGGGTSGGLHSQILAPMLGYVARYRGSQVCTNQIARADLSTLLDQHPYLGEGDVAFYGFCSAHWMQQ